MVNTDKIIEKVILVAVNEGDEAEAKDSLKELADLCKTAGAEVVGEVMQNLERRNPGTYVGTGKVDEIADLNANLCFAVMSRLLLDFESITVDSIKR